MKRRDKPGTLQTLIRYIRDARGRKAAGRISVDCNRTLVLTISNGKSSEFVLAGNPSQMLTIYYLPQLFQYLFVAFSRESIRELRYLLFYVLIYKHLPSFH